MLPCAHCGEQIAEDTTVCPYCGAFEPFSTALPEAPEHPEQATAERAHNGLIKGLLQDIGCHLAVGCGGLVALGVVIALVSVLTVLCGGSQGDYGYDPDTQVVNCQEYVDSAVEANVGVPWFGDDVMVLSIKADLKRDRVDWDKRVCPGVAETTDGKYEIWYFVTDYEDEEWTLDFEMRPLSMSDGTDP